MADSKILISFDLHAEMGMFKKPDINNTCLTFNMLHKPALLGLLGAIVGLDGYKTNGEFPEYYQKLKHLLVGIRPQNDDKGMFSKCIITYNNGTGFGKEGSIQNITEQILIAPSYCCYLLLDKDNDIELKLYDYILNYKAEYLPYFGKNEFSAWWSDVQEHPNAKLFGYDNDYKIKSIFSKTSVVSKYIAQATTSKWESSEIPFMYFERLPIGFDERQNQYEYADFVYSNALFQKGMRMEGDGKFVQINTNDVIQLF